jgi:NADPH-dependent 2,4-dienoyl-CoA reductase/sulfur reductase-like enzyme
LIAPFSYYEEREIKLRLGQVVVGLDLEHRRIYLDHKEVIGFSGLIIAVGGRPRIPERLAVFEDLMITLKTLDDAEKWKNILPDVEEVAIIGGDLTSMALTRSLITLGKSVSFVFNQEAFWPMRRTDELMDAARRNLSKQGVRVVEGMLRSVIKRSDRHYEVITDSEQVKAGLVGAFFGLVPDVHFLVGSGLQIERGILVDEHLYTGFPGVYAAGDCAQVYHPELRDYWVSIGYDNARSLGRLAAVNLAGGFEEVRAAPESIFCDHDVRANTSWWMEF